MQIKNDLPILKNVSLPMLLVLVLLLQACNTEDPKPVNEEEVITTLHVALVPRSGGNTVDLEFYDADGEHGSIEPTISVSDTLLTATTYDAVIELLNETATPTVNISEEVAREANDHLFCFVITGDIVVNYEDEDENGLPLGLSTSWVTGSAGSAEVIISLRHQAGTKTGKCPGTGETDVEVSFPLVVK